MPNLVESKIGRDSVAPLSYDIYVVPLLETDVVWSTQNPSRRIRM